MDDCARDKIRIPPSFSLFNQRTHHIFMSYRPQGTATTFADHLYAALTKAGLYTFRDHHRKSPGMEEYYEEEEFKRSRTEQIITQSNSSLIIFSKDYASSSRCLDELVMILECKRKSDHRVLPVYYDVDPSDVRRQLGRIGEAFVMFEQRFKTEIDLERRRIWTEKVKLWRKSLKEAADLAGLVVTNVANGHESKVIEKIVKVMEDKVSRVVLKGPAPLIGIHSRAKNIQLWLQDADY